MNKKILTLCLVHQHPRILLGLKKRGFGAGRLNGFGGKVEIGESIEEAAKRELFEEAGLISDNLEKRGVLNFSFEHEPIFLELHVFRVASFSGELQESEEMKPEWFSVDEIPFEKMWSDDLHWLPMFLKGKKFKGKFHMDKPSDAEYSSKILEKEIFEVEEL